MNIMRTMQIYSKYSININYYYVIRIKSFIRHEVNQDNFDWCIFRNIPKDFFVLEDKNSTVDF